MVYLLISRLQIRNLKKKMLELKFFPQLCNRSIGSEVTTIKTIKTKANTNKLNRD